MSGRDQVRFIFISENRTSARLFPMLSSIHLMGALAEFERALIVERTKAGLLAARKRSVIVGRPRSLTTAQIKHAQKLIEAGESPTSIAQSLSVDRSTLYRALRKTPAR